MNDRVARPGEHANAKGGIDWSALMSHEVVDGDEMSCGEIAVIAGVSKQAIQQIEWRALKKFAAQAWVVRWARGWIR